MVSKRPLNAPFALSELKNSSPAHIECQPQIHATKYINILLTTTDELVLVLFIIVSYYHIFQPKHEYGVNNI